MKTENKIIISVDDSCEHFIIHYKQKENWNKSYSGDIYFAAKSHSFDGEEFIRYNDKNSSVESHDELNDECRLAFSFNFCWRGVWEGRIYFPNDEEFWDEELETFNLLWIKVKEFFKSKIKEDNKNDYFDE